MNEMSTKVILPEARGLFYGGARHASADGGSIDVLSPATGEFLCSIADGGPVDADRAVAAARKGFKVWRAVLPLERGRILREAAAILRRNGRELAALDAIDGGNPVTEMGGDVAIAALIGSVPTGRAVMRAAAETIKPVLLQLGGKNALIAFPDADPELMATAAVSGMNFTWSTISATRRRRSCCACMRSMRGRHRPGLGQGDGGSDP